MRKHWNRQLNLFVITGQSLITFLSLSLSLALGHKRFKCKIYSIYSFICCIAVSNEMHNKNCTLTRIGQSRKIKIIGIVHFIIHFYLFRVDELTHVYCHRNHTTVNFVTIFNYSISGDINRHTHTEREKEIQDE